MAKKEANFDLLNHVETSVMVESKFNCNSIGILHQIRGLWQEQWRNIRESSTFEMKIQADLNAL